MKLVLSSISTDHSLLKQHWSQSQGDKDQCPITTLGSLQKPTEDPGGLLAIWEDGKILKQVHLTLAAGLLRTEEGFLVSAADHIYRLGSDLEPIGEPISLPSFNALHSLARTPKGYLVASTGVDALVEFDLEGRQLWSWWATENGFPTTPRGEERVLDQAADHRKVRYGTLAQTTHVNSVAYWNEQTLLATFFHQGTVVAIDRQTGESRTVLEDLDHPHAVRVLDEEHFTVADTKGGRALLVRARPDVQAEIVAVIQTDTDWLQDAAYHSQYDRWTLVDGKRSRILVYAGRRGEELVEEISLDPEWRLYETILL